MNRCNDGDVKRSSKDSPQGLGPALLVGLIADTHLLLERSLKPIAELLILDGDYIYKTDYGKMLAYHVANAADMMVACLEIPVDRGRSLRCDERGPDRRVIDLHEKRAQPATIPGKRSRASKEPNNVND